MSITSEITKSISTGAAKAYKEANNAKKDAYTSAANTYIDAINNSSSQYIDSLTSLNNQQNEQLTQTTEQQIQGTRQQYQKAYDYNAINSELQQRQVADRMANLGLTDSGLNMTNQTAIAVSRINGDNSVTQQYNNAVSTLRSNLQQALAENNRTLATNVANINKETADNVANINSSLATTIADIDTDTAQSTYEIDANNKSKAKSITQTLISTVTSETDKTKNAITIYSAAKTYRLSEKSIKKLLSYANISWSDYLKWTKDRNFFSNASGSVSNKTSNKNGKEKEKTVGGDDDSFEETTNYKNALKTMSLHFRSPSSSKLNKKDVTSYIKQLKKTYSLTDAQVEKLTEIITDRYDLE